MHSMDVYFAECRLEKSSKRLTNHRTVLQLYKLKLNGIQRREYKRYQVNEQARTKCYKQTKRKRSRREKISRFPIQWQSELIRNEEGKSHNKKQWKCKTLRSQVTKFHWFTRFVDSFMENFKIHFPADKHVKKRAEIVRMCKTFWRVWICILMVTKVSRRKSVITTKRRRKNYLKTRRYVNRLH